MVKVKKESTWNTELATELHKQKRVHFPRRTVIANGIDEIWSADLVDMQAFSKFNRGVKYLLTVIDVFSKYAWAIPLVSKEGKSVTEAFDIIKRSKRKPKFLWVDKGTEFYNRTFQKWLRENNIEMYSTHNEGKAVVIERFNRTLKGWMWKYFSEQSTSKYIDVLGDLLDYYNNKKHRTIKMTPQEASLKKNEPQVYENIYGDKKLMADTSTAKFQIGDKVRIAKLKRHFEKGYTPNWTEEVFEIDNINPTNPLTCTIQDLSGDRIEGSFYQLGYIASREMAYVENLGQPAEV